MAPVPTGPSASRGPPTGPKVRTAVPVALTGGAHASGGSSSSSGNNARPGTVNGGGPVAVAFGSSYGYDKERARLLSGGQRGGRGRGFGRANGAFHGHMGSAMPGQPYPGAYQAPYGSALQQQHLGQGYAGYDYSGQYVDPSMVAGPSSAPYPPTSSGTSAASTTTQPKHKATAPKPPNRPPTPPPPPPLEPDPDASIADKRSPVKIALPRITAKDKAKSVIRSPVKDKAMTLADEAKPRRPEKERQPEFLPTDEASRSPISITFGASAKAKTRPSHLDLDNAHPSSIETPLGSADNRSDRPPTPPLADAPPSPPPPPPDIAPDAPPTPPLDLPISPRVSISIPISPRLKRPPTSPRPAPPRLQPPASPLAPETKRPPTSPKPRIQSLAKPPTGVNPGTTSRASSKWDVGPTAVNGQASHGVGEVSAPPANHFREMPSQAETDDEDDASDEDDSEDEAEIPSWSREMPPHRQVPPHLAHVPAEAPPPPPPKSPTPPPPPAVEPEPPLWSIPRCVGSYIITLSEDGRKEVARRVDGLVDGQPIEVLDPRKEGYEGRGAAKVVTTYRPVTYPWGPLSVGPRPPEPATAVLITGLSPLTTADQVRTFLRPHGRIRELDAKMDTKSGMQLGICWVKFDGPAGSASGDRGRKGGSGQSAHDVAVAVIKACNGHRVGMTSTERITMVLDGEGKKAVKAVKEEMERRYPKPRPVPVAAVPPPKPATQMAPPLSTVGGRGTPTSGAATPRVPSLGSTPQSTNAKPLPVPVPIKLHAQYKAGLPRNPALSMPSTSIPPAYAAPRAVPLAAPPKMPTYLPARPVGLPSRPPTQSFTSSFVDAPFEKDRRDRSRDRQRSRDHGRERARGRTDTYLASRSSSYSRSPPPRSRFRSPSTDYSSDSESDSDYYRRGRFRNRGRSRSRSRTFSRSPRRDSYAPRDVVPSKDSRRADGHVGQPLIPRRDVKQKVEDDEKTKMALAKNGRPAVWIDKDVLGITQQNEVYLWDHFRNFRPENIIRAPTGFYVLFADHDSAERAKILDGSVVHGTKIALVIKTGHAKARPVEGGPSAVPVAVGAKGKLVPANSTKVVSPVAIKTKAKAAVSKVAKVAKVVKRRIAYTSSEESEDEQPAKRAKVQATADEQRHVQEKVPTPVKAVPAVEELAEAEGESEIELDVAVEMTDAKDAPKGKKRSAAKVDPAPAPATKKAKKGKKAQIVSPAPLITPPYVEEPPVAEIKLDEPAIVPPTAVAEVAAPVKATTKASKPKTARVKKSTLPPLERFIAEEQVIDEEDAYWLSRALALPEGTTSDVEEDDTEMDPLLSEDHPLHHTSGAWRVEGLRKVPPALKSAYLPQRNRAQAAAEDASALGTGLTTGRTARASGRRLALDMETHRKTLVSGAANAARETAAAASTAENDIFAFNQLRIRKKQLRFARSAIEGYGLYAMETIQTGEMVCEYVGELVRSSVADLREAKYLKQGIGSSYLFRIDADVVCDATFRGSVSRLINHSCDPSASAKIISINGQSKIVIYAKRLLSPGEEILYDYKFPLESDPALRVPCLCGSKICRGFLN